MIVDTRNPEVSEQLAAWFERRDQLCEARESGECGYTEVAEMLSDLVDIGDELVAFLCPTPADRAEHTGAEVVGG